MDTAAFLKVADKFIDVANRENTSVVASDLHMAFLYAAARYNAFVARGVLNVDNDEAFVAEMAGHYQEMLRQHLADPGLLPDGGGADRGSDGQRGAGSGRGGADD